MQPVAPDTFEQSTQVNYCKGSNLLKLVLKPLACCLMLLQGCTNCDIAVKGLSIEPETPLWLCKGRQVHTPKCKIKLLPPGLTTGT